jgi:hypothetical protein
VYPYLIKGCRMGIPKWHNRSEHIAFDEFWFISGVKFGEFAQIPHAGSKYIRVPDIGKKFAKIRF